MSKEKKPDIQIVSREGNVITFPTAIKRVQFGEIIKTARTKRGMTQQEAAKRIGVTRHAIMNWETNKSKPDHAYIPRVCSVLGITLQELYQMKPEFTSSEHGLIQEFRLLKPATQRVVKNLVKSMLDEELAAHDEMLVNTYKIADLRQGGVAAGLASSGIEIVEEPATPIFIKINEITKNADAVVTVKGHSMEPIYHPEDKVCFEYTNVASVGDDIVVCWAGRNFIKRMGIDGTLFSLNDDYPFVYEGDGTDISILGKVLGILGKEDLPNESDRISLQELFRKELMEKYDVYF